MNKMKWVLAALFALMLPVMAMAQGSVLLLDMPEDAQMVENVEFDDGDFIQTYQLSGGATIQLLRYANMGMSLEELAASDWPGASVEAVEIQLEGADACCITAVDEASGEISVLLVLVRTQDADLVLSAVFPAAMGETQIAAQMDALLASLQVMDGGAADENAEVG